MKLDSKEELLNDFQKMISSLDFKNYNPSSPEFMSALFIGLMWQILSDIPDEEEMDVFGCDIIEELDDAEKYLDMFHKTTDIQYKQMATDELRHAKMLMNMKSNEELTSDEEELLHNYEHRRETIASKMM